MKTITTFLLLIGLCVLFACGGGNDNSVSDEALANGKKTYSTYCVACHGADGMLALNGAKKFPESTLGLEERISIITNGKNLMTPFKGILKEEEIKQVAAYTMKLSAGEK